MYLLLDSSKIQQIKGGDSSVKRLILDLYALLIGGVPQVGV